MSARAHDTPETTCAGCGSLVAAAAGYCPGCGAPVEAASNTTLRIEPPEPSESPISFSASEPRWFGVPPAGLLIGLTVLLFVLAAVLLAVGHWPYALIAAVLGALVASLFMEVAGRRPDGEVARRSRRSVDAARARAGAALEAMAIRSRAQREAAVLRLELRQLQTRRRELVAAFGDAVYRELDTAMLRSQIEALDARAEALDGELHALAARAGEEGVAKARLAGQATQLVSVPEPYPPPDEDTPPAPAEVPEPYPPPDEGTLPQPDPVPAPAEPSER